MNIFECCPKKPKMSLDYIIKWIESNDKTIKEVVTWVQELQEMDLKSIFDEYALTYPWDEVPEFNVKADKVINATVGNFASLDAEGNLQDSGKKASDFAPASHFHELIKCEGTGNNAGDYASVVVGEDSIDMEIEKSSVLYSAEINTTNFANLLRALQDPAAPILGGNSLITNGQVFTALQGKADTVHTHSGIEEVIEGSQSAKLYADNRTQGEPAIIIELADNNTPGSPVTKSANINIDNIDDLNRALTTPSSIPENDATKLITSKAVYDALASKADGLKTLCISYDGQSQAETNYPISSSDKTLISAFIESVPENQYVPVIVMLMDDYHADGTVIGLAKWNSSTSNNISSIGVEVTIGKYKYNCDDYTVQDLECWYRTAIGQYHL